MSRNPTYGFQMW